MNEDRLREILNEELAQVAGQLFKRFDALDTKIDAKADAQRVYHSLDTIADRVRTDEVERAAITQQLNRHEGWHHQEAERLGLTLNY